MFSSTAEIQVQKAVTTFDKAVDASDAGVEIADKFFNAYKDSVDPADFQAVVGYLENVDSDYLAGIGHCLDELIKQEKNEFPSAPSKWSWTGQVKESFCKIAAKNKEVVYAYFQTVGLPELMVTDMFRHNRCAREAFFNCTNAVGLSMYKKMNLAPPLWAALKTLEDKQLASRKEIGELGELIVYSEAYGYVRG